MFKLVNFLSGALLLSLVFAPASYAGRNKRVHSPQFGAYCNDNLTLSVVQGYQEWARSYDNFPSVMVRLEELKLKNLIYETIDSIQKPQRALDIAVGTGRALPMLQYRFAKTVGVDISPEMLEKAKKVALSSTELVLGDFRQANFSDKFDFVHFSLALKYFPSVDEVIAKIAENTKEGGVLYMADTSDRQLRAGSKPRVRAPKTGVVYSIDHYVHSFNSILQSLERHGFTVEKSGYVQFDHDLAQLFPHFSGYAGRDVLYYFVARKVR